VAGVVKNALPRGKSFKSANKHCDSYNAGTEKWVLLGGKASPG